VAKSKSRIIVVYEFSGAN